MRKVPAWILPALKSLVNDKRVAGLVLAFWLAVIFFFSSLPSELVTETITLNTIIRKLAHFFEYGLLCVLTMNFLLQFKISFHQATSQAIIFCLIFALSDEWHQSFVIGRSAKIEDVVIDMAGVIIGLWIFIIFQKERQSLTEN